MMGAGISMIAAERERQIIIKGWTAEHDDAHTDGSLAMAASCYARIAGQTAPASWVGWPWGDGWEPSGDRVRDLVKAGALIAAEIDRLNRATIRDRTLRLAQGLRVIRDTTEGYASNVARRALDEADMADPREDISHRDES